MISRAFIANTGEDSISVISTQDWKVIGKIQLRPLHTKYDIDRIFTTTPTVGPYQLVIDNHKRYLYCANAYDDSISVIDVWSYEIVSTTLVGSNPMDLCLSPDNHYIYVCCSDSDSISIVCGISGKLIGTISVGSFPQSVDISEDGRLLIVANMDSKSITVIDTKYLDKHYTIYGNNHPVKAVFNNRDGLIYATNTHADYNENGTISIIDYTKGKVIKEIYVGRGPIGIQFLEDQTKALVANAGNQDICLIDFRKGQIVASAFVGNMPHAICLDEKNEYALIVNTEDNTMNVLDLRTFHVTHTINVGKEPNGIIIA